MQSNQLRTIVVTGANKGIGYAIVDRLLRQSTAYDIILTARNTKFGEQARDDLSQKNNSSASKLTYRQLDVSDTSSIDEFVKWVKSEREGKVDVLVNNAGVANSSSEGNKREPIHTNFTGTVELTEKLLPHLANDGKIINVSSQMGGLSLQGSIKSTLEDPNMTREKLMGLSNDLIKAVQNGNHTELGWSKSLYGASKALLNAYTRWVLVKMLKGDQQCYTLHPGWVQTDMGGAGAPEPVEKGADTPVYLINLPFKYDERYNGKFFSDCKLREF